ncbi:hypothetical protein [Georgenia alba]|uniref:Right handed beta helix domain-containing protein n=1 Tax=Georgenia alba TaxID=2233858 RepID=A0ABW2Q6Y0_9MICO
MAKDITITVSRTLLWVATLVIVVVIAVVGVLVTLDRGRPPPPTAEGAEQGETAPERTPEAPETPTVSAPQLSDFPDADSTGVPAGVQLVEEDGNLRIDEDGAVVEGLEIFGSVTVDADDVVIRNSRIVMTSGRIALRVNGDDLLVEDTEIDGQGRADPVVAFNGYTLRRVHIHNIAEGPRVAGDDVTIEDSYIHSMVQRDDNHTDVIQVVKGERIVIRGNNLQAHNPESGLYGNAAFMFGEDSGPVRDCLVEGNLMNGGNYTVNGGGSGTDGAECAFRENAFQQDHRHGMTANLGPGVDWDETNVILGTTTPVG